MREQSVRRNTQGEVLREALALFNDRGYEGASLRELAERLGITPAALYYHFDSKHDILFNVVKPLLDGLDQALANAATGQEPSEILGGVLDVFIEHRSVMTWLLQDISAIRQPGIGERFRDEIEQLMTLLTGKRANEADVVRATAALGAILRPLGSLPQIEMATHRQTLLDAASCCLEVGPS